MVKKYLLRIILLCSVITLFFNKVSAQYAQSGTADPKLVRAVYWLTFGEVNNTYGSDDIPTTPGSTLRVAPSGYLGPSTPTQPGQDNVGPKITAGLYQWQFSPTVRIEATISNIVYPDPNKNRLSPYTPGGDQADRLQYMFSNTATGNNGIPNSAIACPYSGLVMFDISMDLKILINGVYTSVNYPGVVLADGETVASGPNYTYNGNPASSGEFFGATAETNLQFQLLSKIFSPVTNSVTGQPYTPTDAADYQLTLSNGGNKFVVQNNNGPGNEGVGSVFFVRGGKAFKSVTMQGQGRTAIALGFIIPFDQGDNPSSYGFTGNYIDSFNFTDAIKPDATYSIIPDVPTTTLTPKATVFIGAPDGNGLPTVDADGPQLGNIYSSADDSTGVTVSNLIVNDENTFTGSNKPSIRANQDGDLVLNFPSITNTKNTAAKLYAWVDFNNDGKYTQNEEMELVIPANTAGQPFTITYPNASFKNIIKVGPLYARFRVTTNALAALANTSDNNTVDPRSQSYAADGETEDYRFNDVTGLTISGSVYDDGNGGSDNTISGTAIQKAGTVQLYAYLANSSGVLLNKATVASDGSYSFTNVNNSSNSSVGTYTVAISTTSVATGTNISGLPASGGLPTGYVPSGASYGVNNIGRTSNAVQTGTTPNLQIFVNTPYTNLNVTGVNFGIDAAPIAVNDPGNSVGPSNTIIIDAPANDADGPAGTPDGTLDKTTVLLIDPADSQKKTTVTTTAGTYTVNATTGKVSFTAASNFAANTSITYTIKDNFGAESNVATIGITYAPGPSGNPDNATTTIGNPVTTDVRANDSDATGTVTTPGTSTNGGTTTVNSSTQIVTYTPATNFTGKDTYTYNLTNNTGTSGPITVTVNVKPVGVTDTYTTTIGTANTNNDVTTNDGASVTGTNANATVTNITTPSHGTATLNPGTKVITYTPSANYVGKDSYTYKITSPDGFVTSDAITVNVNVKPVGVADTYTTPIQTASNENVKSNDGASGTATGITVTSLNATTPKGGTTTVDANGVVTYTPAAGFIGKDGYAYTLTTADGVASSAIAVVVSVKPVGVNDTYFTSVGSAVVNTVKDNDGASATGTTVTLVTPPGHGTATVNNTNTSFTYTPAAGYVGTDSYTYTLTTSDNVVSDPITVTITISANGTDDTDITPINTPKTTDVKANDGTGYTNATVISTSPTTKGGTTQVDNTNKVLYTPPTDFIGKDTYTYTLTNPGGNPTPAVNVTINVKPVGVNDTYFTTVSTPVSNPVKNNDGASATGTTVAVVTPPTHGGITATNTNTSFTYTPTAGYVGTDTYTYSLTTADGVVSDPITVNITISNNGVPDNDSTPINTAKTTDVKANDGATYTNATVTPTSPTNKGGTAVVDNTGKVLYTPPAGFIGKDTYTYTLTNPGGSPTPSITVTVSVKPVGVNDTYTTSINTLVANTVKDNDGPSATGTTVAVATSPSHGTVVANNTNTAFNYTPANGYVGTDTYTYTLNTTDGVLSDPITVTITINPSGVADADVTTINTPKTTDVKANDGSTYTNATVTPTSPTSKGGTTTVDNTGKVVYTPASGFIGKDTYTYTLTNTGGSPSAPVTVTISVKPVGVNDTYATPINTPVANTVKDNDGASATGTTVAVATQPAHGTLVANNTNTSFTYTPTTGYSGTDTYTYTLTTADGVVSDPITVNITISANGTPDTDTTPINTAKTTDVKANDGSTYTNATVTPTSPTTKGGTAVVDNTGKVVYTPPTGFIGKDTYTYTLTNTGSSPTPPITVTINVKPVGVNDTYSTSVGTPVANTVKDNDGASATGTTVAVLTLPTHGSVSANNTNTAFTYTPTAGYIGTDTYTYTLTTSDGVVSDPITVTITINANGTPDTDTTPINTAKTTDVKANDGSTYTNAAVTPASPTTKGGTVVNDGSDKVVYTPPANFTGKDTYTYTLTNSGGTPTPAITVTIAVKPVGVNDSYSTAINTAVTNDVKSNDGASANGTTITAVTSPAHGTVTANSSNTLFTYTPANNYIGTDTYTYTLTTVDGVVSDPIIVTINVVNPGNSGVSDADITKINTAKTTNVRANDGSTFTNATVTPQSPTTKGGTVSNDGSNNVIYTPPTNFIGKDTYTYTLTNSGGTPTSPITVTISVKPVGMNDVYATSVNTAVNNDVKSNDGPSAIGTTVATVTQPAHGAVFTNGSNTAFTYTPATGYVGTDTYTYSLTTTDGVISDPITVTVNIANSGSNGTLSTGGTPDVDITTINTQKTTNVKSNDGSNNTNATVTPQSPTTKGGTVVNDGAGNVIYTPPTNFIGKDGYTYTLTNAGGTPTSPITVLISVKPVGVNDNYTTPVNTAITNTVKDNDGASAVGTTVTLVSPPTYGTVTANTANTAFTYTPNTGYIGTDSYTYSLTTSDGVVSDPITVNITIVTPGTAGISDADATIINTPKTTDVKANDGSAFTNATVTPTPTTAKGGTAVNDGANKVTYTPPTNFIGKDSYTYTLTNSGGSPTAPVTVNITVKPVGVNDVYSTAVGVPVINDVKVNDGASGNGTILAVATQPSHGTVSAPNNANTYFTYNPAAGYVGTDSYTYTLITADGVASDPITVIINIVTPGANGTPDSDVTKINTSKVTNVKANDGTTFASAVVTPQSPTTKGGTVTNDGAGNVIYTPATGFIGKDTYTYTLTNSGGTPTSPITVTIAVKPVGVRDIYSTGVNTPVNNDVKTNDGASAIGTTVAVATPPVNGTVTANTANTSFTYTPATGYVGTDTYTYTLTTADGVVSDPITVVVNIVASGTNGTLSTGGSPDMDITLAGIAKTTNVKANDGSNNTNATVTPQSGTTAKGGTVTNDGSGNVIYTPAAGFTGVDTYTYTLTNGGNTTQPITVTINVRPVGVNDTYSTPINTAVNNPVTTNDGASATNNTVVVVSPPVYGVVTASGNTAFNYTPANGFTGTDTYTYALVTPDGIYSAPITVTVIVGAPPSSLKLTKVANNGASAAGDVINYTLVVTNTNNAAVTNVKVADAGADAGSVTPASVAVLAAGASTTFTAKHTVTLADVAAGIYSNQASATAVDINGNPVSKLRSDNPATPAVDDPTVVQILPKGGISLVKTGVSDFTSATFTFTITNTGNLTLTNLSLTDALLNITNSPVTVAGGLAPGAKTIVTFKYTLLQADRDAGKVINSATINATDANNNTVTNTSTVTVAVPLSPTSSGETVSTKVGQVTTFSPAANDQTSGAAFVAIEILQQPKHGTLKINADLSVTYTPDPGYNGADSFIYRLKDVNGFYTNASAVAIFDGFVNNLKIPNTFTPNGDGVNDTFEIIGIDAYPINELIIVNRWGNEVYHKTNYTKEWTGEGLNEGTYYFLLHLKGPDGSDIEVIKGYVSLIRNRVN